MAAVAQAETVDQRERNKAVYRRFVEIINTRELDAMPEVLDVEKLREFGVGAMPDWYAYDDAVANLKRVLAGIPDVKLEIEDSVAEGNKVVSKVTVSGTNSGRLFNMPATGRSFRGPIFDFVELEDGVGAGVLVVGLIGGLIAALLV